MTDAEILALPMRDNDAGAETVGEYLRLLLATLWAEEEGFSGKRPFGNSGWTRDLYHAVIKGGASDGTVDEDGDIEDKGDAPAVIAGVIDRLFMPASPINASVAAAETAMDQALDQLDAVSGQMGDALEEAVSSGKQWATRADKKAMGQALHQLDAVSRQLVYALEHAVSSGKRWRALIEALTYNKGSTT